MDQDLNRYILMNEGKGLVPGYPKSMLDLVGKTNIAAVHGAAHKYIRGSLLSLIGSGAIKDQLFPDIDKFMRSFINNWEDKTIDIQDKTIEMAFYISFRQIIEVEADSIYKAFKEEFDKVATGTLSLAIYIPGSNYYQGLQARKKAIKILKQIIADRKASGKTHNDMLAELVGNEKTRYHLNEEQIFDQVFTILYSGYETVSITTMMAIKYLHDNPKALQQLREEHFAIRERKKPDEPIDWNDYKSMSFTRAVILETSRLATVVNGVLRKTTQDVELNGMLTQQTYNFIYNIVFEVKDSSFQKDGKYIFSQGGSTMIQASIQSLLHSILGDGWIRAWSLTNTASYLELEAGCVLERNWA
uniref:Cytochrome P450 n=1 Tax=Fagus sylvatica TaxID=28930 RepID=A0A2N9EUE7_FAGSY